ncbi:MAG: hypothetical protein JWM81_805 [Candidatus Saccharibacteria bacterium]|nr:hypothetical protein [Candidatus Saccharibacteria bacterium]
MSINETHHSIPPSPELVDSFDRSDITAHLKNLGSMDSTALVHMLLPHRLLPNHDPAGYLISVHNSQTDDISEIRSSYDLGVTFGRSLAHSFHRDKGILPVVSDFDASNKKMVDTYLARSRKIPVSELIRNSGRTHADIYRAAEIFKLRCIMVVPHLMMEPNDVTRGCHDYFSIIRLLETDKQEQQKVLRLSLGHISLWQKFSSVSALFNPAHKVS